MYMILTASRMGAQTIKQLIEWLLGRSSYTHTKPYSDEIRKEMALGRQNREQSWLKYGLRLT